MPGSLPFPHARKARVPHRYGRNPEVLILELAIGKPGDMKYLMSFVPVDVGVLTAIGEFPVHMEFFPEKDALILEKAHLLNSISKSGLAVLNYDDLSVRMVGDNLPKELKTKYYGFGYGADLTISNFQLVFNNLKRDETYGWKN